MAKHSGLLYGVNRKCKGCIGECKQFEQVTVVCCPNWVKKVGKVSEVKDSKHKNIVDLPCGEL